MNTDVDNDFSNMAETFSEQQQRPREQFVTFEGFFWLFFEGWIENWCNDEEMKDIRK